MRKLLAVSAIIPFSIAWYIGVTTWTNGSTFCHRYDNGSVEVVYRGRENEGNLTDSQIEERVRRQMRGASFTREAAYIRAVAGEIKVAQCRNHEFLRFPHSNRDV